MVIKLSINISNAFVYTTLAILIILGLGIGVMAYNSGRSPNVFGHSGEEIEVIVSGQTKLLNNALTDLNTSINTVIQSNSNTAWWSMCGCYKRSDNNFHPCPSGWTEYSRTHNWVDNCYGASDEEACVLCYKKNVIV